MSYIYKITNTVNNKSYIGYTKDSEKRWKGHQFGAGSLLIYQAIKKYGINCFKFEVIANETVDKEDEYIVKYNTIAPSGYNITKGGSLPPNHKGKTYKEIYGRRWKEQVEKRTKLQLERGGYGPVTHTKATKKKISAAVSGKNNPMYGKKQSEKTKKLIGQANQGRLLGVKNPNSKKWILVSPKGKKYETVGNLKGKCKELGLSFATIHASHRYNRPMRSGWKILQK